MSAGGGGGGGSMATKADRRRSGFGSKGNEGRRNSQGNDNIYRYPGKELSAAYLILYCLLVVNTFGKHKCNMKIPLRRIFWST